MRKISAKRKIVQTRLKAFSSFVDNFALVSLKSGWTSLSGTWIPAGNTLTSANSTALISVPVSKTNATTVVGIPSGQTGIGPAFWISSSGSYWASFANTTTSIGASNCNNGNCSGSETYTATRNCSCSDQYGTCQQIYGTCQSSTSASYGTCSQTTGTCQSSTSTAYGTCAIINTYGTCSYTAGGTTYNSLGCYSAFSGCNSGTETTCNGPGGMNVCGCPCGQSKVCCYTTTVTSGSWNYGGCSYSGQQVVTGAYWNYGGCSYSGQQVAIGTTTTWNYSGCSYNGQVVNTGWNYSGCSSVGQQIFLGNVTTWNYGGCSSNGQQVYLGYNYGGCSSNGQQVVIGQSSNCNNGSCSGSESYTATRNCSCPTNTSRIIRTIKSLNGTVSTVGSFVVSSAPTSITIQTSGTSVTVSGGGSSESYTNTDGTIYNKFGIIKNDGGTEQGSSATSFTVNAS